MKDRSSTAIVVDVDIVRGIAGRSHQTLDKEPLQEHRLVIISFLDLAWDHGGLDVGVFDSVAGHGVDELVFIFDGAIGWHLRLTHSSCCEDYGHVSLQTSQWTSLQILLARTLNAVMYMILTKI